MAHRAELVVAQRPPFLPSPRDNGSVELVAVPRHDVTRLWPSSAESSGLFALAVLPVRLAALAALWATSSPFRFLLAAATGIACAVAAIR
jgi:hypothetical protein